MLKKLGFTMDELREMTLSQAVFWLEALAYDFELQEKALRRARRGRK